MISIENILSKEDCQKLSKEAVASINEAINKDLDARSNLLEKDLKQKFETMVEGLADKFNSSVDGAILESVNASVGDKVNKKMFNLIQGMVSLLENSGIVTTERSQELILQLKEANANLRKAVEDRDTIKEAMDLANKEKLILQHLQGMKPEIVRQALEYFKDKDMTEVQDEIEHFLNGNFANLTPSSDEGDLENLDLDKIDEALEEIEETENKEDKVKNSQMATAFEALGKGLKQPRLKGLNRTPNITQTILESSAKSIQESEDNDDMVSDDASQDRDAIEALGKIKDLNDLGYGYTQSNV